jgi:hypothetical protein
MKFGDCAIFNTLKLRDTESMGHWMVAVRDAECMHIYDSFGRSKSDLALKSVRNSKMTDSRPEQNPFEEDCGYRCLAFIRCIERFGIEDVCEVL